MVLDLTLSFTHREFTSVWVESNVYCVFKVDWRRDFWPDFFYNMPSRCMRIGKMEGRKGGREKERERKEER